MTSISTGSFKVAFAGIVLIGNTCQAANLSVQVSDGAGQPLADVVVYAEPASGPQLNKSQRKVEIEQKGRKFSPLVTVVQTGSEISFPNHDTVRHHVYSFSTPKTFDIKLYSGVPGMAQMFDKPGTVVIGCNIHDQMVAYVHVVSTPYFGKTDANGQARLDGLAAGKYQLKAWHYNLPPAAPIPEQAYTAGANDGSASFKLNAKAALPVSNKDY